MDQLFDFMNQDQQPRETESFGDLLLTWQVKPRRKTRFWVWLAGLVGGLIIFLLIYGRQIIPWLAKLPEILIYLLVFLISPLLKWVSGDSNMINASLYEKGFILAFIDKKQQHHETKMGRWEDYQSCRMDKDRVVLLPNNKLVPRVVLPAPQNPRDVYIICRERIGMAREKERTDAEYGQQVRQSPQQKHLHKVERSIEKRNQRMFKFK